MRPHFTLMQVKLVVFFSSFFGGGWGLVRRSDYNITKWEGSQDPPKVLFNLLVTPILRLQNNIISNLFQAHKEQRRFSLIKLWELVVIFQQTCCNYLIQYFLKYPSKALIAHFTCFVQKVCIKTAVFEICKKAL